MNILFIIDPPEKLHPETDTTLLIMAEAQRRKHNVMTVQIEDLRVEKNIPWAKNMPLHKFSVIMMRKDPPFNMDYITATYILSLVDEQKSFIVNKPEALRNFNEKMGIFNFPDFIPETIVTKKHADIIKFLQKNKKIVLKTLEGFAGHEIFVIDEKDKNRVALLEVMTKNETRYIMAQKYLPAVKNGDKRILILNGEILGQHNRIAATDDHRSNISAGGVSRKTGLTQKERNIATIVAKKLLSMGIYFAGIDMIGGFITEINVTSPTGLVKINEHEGTHLEKKIVDFLETHE